MKICRADRGEDGKTNDGRDAENWNRYSAGWQSGGERGTARWPANVCHDGSAEVLAAFGKFGESKSGDGAVKRASGADQNGNRGKAYGAESRPSGMRMIGHADSGSVARFFYTSKAGPDERLDSRHPTVKPVALMEWLVTLVTPSGGTVLDCFCGTGSTLVACDRLGFDALGIEQDAQTCADAEAKIARMRARRLLGDVTDRTTPAPGQLGFDL